MTGATTRNAKCCGVAATWPEVSPSGSWGVKQDVRRHTAEGTVKNHVSSILGKFGVRDRTRAVLRALETGLLRAPGPAPP